MLCFSDVCLLHPTTTHSFCWTRKSRLWPTHTEVVTGFTSFFFNLSYSINPNRFDFKGRPLTFSVVLSLLFNRNTWIQWLFKSNPRVNRFVNNNDVLNTIFSFVQRTMNLYWAHVHSLLNAKIDATLALLQFVFITVLLCYSCTGFSHC